MTADRDTPTSPPAHVLVDSGALTFGIVTSIVSALATVGFVLSVANGSIILAIILLPIAGIAGVFGWWGFREHLRWEPTELHFDEWPLALGSVNTVRLRRRAKRPIADVAVPISVALTCTEEARYSIGTDTYTASEKVVDRTSPAEGTLAAGLLTSVFEVAIPVDAGAPTLDLSNNKIQWELEVKSAESNLLSVSQHTLLVAARLDRRVHGIQDAPEGPG